MMSNDDDALEREDLVDQVETRRLLLQHTERSQSLHVVKAAASKDERKREKRSSSA